MPNLLLHQGDNRVERSDVKSAHTPSSTKTWQPIAHNKLLETVEDSLSRKGFYITNESHGLSHNGDRYFGLLEIRSGDEHQDYRSVVVEQFKLLQPLFSADLKQALISELVGSLVEG